MASPDGALIARVEPVLAQIKAERDMRRAVHHIAGSGARYFIGIDLMVGQNFALQPVMVSNTDTAKTADRHRDQLFRLIAAVCVCWGSSLAPTYGFVSGERALGLEGKVDR